MQIGYSVIDQIIEAYKAGYTYAEQKTKTSEDARDFAKAHGYKRDAFIDGFIAKRHSEQVKYVFRHR